MTDRRRINGPPAATSPPVFSPQSAAAAHTSSLPTRMRPATRPRKIFLKTGLTPSASGSAYFELEPTPSTTAFATLIPPPSTLKLTCTVHGPRPLPRSAPFTPHLQLSTHVKFAPFATRHRRGYVRDAGEKDLSAHLETALRGVVVGERWPKSGVDVVVTVLEGEEDAVGGGGEDAVDGGAAWGMLGVLAGCLTVASAAMVDAGIDCVDLVSGGVAAVVRGADGEVEIVLDPCPAEHRDILGMCVVGYLAARDELTEIWMKGSVGVEVESLVEGAITAAMAARSVLTEAVKEAVEAKISLHGAMAENEVKP